MESIIIQPEIARESPINVVPRVTPGTPGAYDPQKMPEGRAPEHTKIPKEYLPGGVRPQTWDPANWMRGANSNWPDPSKGWSCQENADWVRGNDFSMRWPSLKKRLEYGVEVPIVVKPENRALDPSYFYPLASFKNLWNPDNYTYPIFQSQKRSEPGFGKPFYNMEGFENTMTLGNVGFILVLLLILIIVLFYRFQ